MGNHRFDDFIKFSIVRLNGSFMLLGSCDTRLINRKNLFTKLRYSSGSFVAFLVTRRRDI